jgi:hypothetical protein
MSDDAKQLVDPPRSTDSTKVTQMGYFSTYDAIAGKDYAFVAYLEEKVATGKWQFKVKSKCTAGSVMDPDQPWVMRAISDAAKKKLDFITFGFNMEPKDDDARCVENRVHFNEALKPTSIVMRLIVRGEDGSPTGEKTLTFDWPGPADEQEKKHLAPPKTTDRSVITELGYVNSYDVIVNKNYAYLAYKEENASTGKWQLKIKALVTAGTTIDPFNPSLKRNLEKAASEGKEFITWGFNLSSKDDDPRLVETRIYVGEDAGPARVEQHVRTRNADGSATDKKVMTIDWPSTA